MFRSRPPLRHACLIRVTVVLTVLTSLFAGGSGAFTVANTRLRATLPVFAPCVAPCLENFDNVVAPTLPAGWTTALPVAQPGDLPWTTANTAFDSFPNSAFANSPNHVTDNRLNSSVVAIGPAGGLMNFERRTKLEERFDGMVLEISIPSVAGGAFQDIISAGGSFITGGYDSTIFGTSSSPIAGRSAWTGDTFGFESTSVRLPASAHGRSVTFRWRVVTDSSVSGEGAFIDSITLIEPPTNDNFSNAQPILGSSGMINGTNVAATKEPNEPSHAGISGNASVWYRWQAPDSGRFAFTTFGSSSDTLLAVYTGGSFAGTPVQSNDEEPSGCIGFSSIGYSGLAFNAVGGAIYHIVVDKKDFSISGNVRLRWGRSATIRGSVTSASGGFGGAEGVRLEGDTCRRNLSGGINFTDVPTGGSYNVTIQSSGRFYTQWPTNASISPLTGDVLDFNFYLISPVFNISGLVTINNGALSDLTVTCTSGPPGNVTRTVTPSPSGFFECGSLPILASYVVTPSKLGFVFAPSSATVTMQTQSVSIPPFTGSPAPTRTISGRLTLPNGTTGVSGVSVALSGSQTASSVTDATGNYSFTGVAHGGNYTIAPSSTNLTFTPANLSFNNLTANQTANFTATFLLQLILDDVGQVGALDSVLLLRDPFPVINTANLLNRGVDRNTRVAIFLSNFQLGPGELPSSVVINLIGSNSQSYDIPAEDVRPLPDGLTRVTFRLPDTLTAGTCTLVVKARGLTSNMGAMSIR